MELFLSNVYKTIKEKKYEYLQTNIKTYRPKRDELIIRNEMLISTITSNISIAVSKIYVQTLKKYKRKWIEKRETFRHEYRYTFFVAWPTDYTYCMLIGTENIHQKFKLSILKNSWEIHIFNEQTEGRTFWNRFAIKNLHKQSYTISPLLLCECVNLGLNLPNPATQQYITNN